MARKWQELKDELYRKLTPEEREAHRRKSAELIEEVRLDMMRRELSLTQAALAMRLGVDQGSISRMEKQADMHLSTLRDYVQAAGGTLELRAVFPTQTFTLSLSK